MGSVDEVKRSGRERERDGACIEGGNKDGDGRSSRKSSGALERKKERERNERAELCRAELNRADSFRVEPSRFVPI